MRQPKPPGICPGCWSEADAPRTGDRHAFMYCPHEKVLAMRNPGRAGWTVLTHVSPAQYYEALGAAPIALRA